ncbi:MAG: hypothetical protein D6726_01350 [Nitrospirae bacterium]|nr:MAG: hypothetical protein D6726_01350 [Nitrospirota bacterium]
MRSAVLTLVLLLCVAGFVSGYKYYRFIEEDPDYCSSCHLMEEGYRSWRLSKHSQIVCQRCHAMSVFEGNRILIAYVSGAEGAPRQEHGREQPWRACLNCHTQEASQGSVTLRKSYGHARHVFMENITCNTCHTGNDHAFGVDQQRCQKCHKDKLVHGMGMAGTYCLNCHSYGEKAPGMTRSERCLECHVKIPRAGVMASLRCYECHHPHEKLKMTEQDCLSACHGNEAKVGQHGLHAQKTGLTCLDCHKPHTWRVGEKEAKGLCDRCHPYRPPARFIY